MKNDGRINVPWLNYLMHLFAKQDDRIKNAEDEYQESNVIIAENV